MRQLLREAIRELETETKRGNGPWWANPKWTWIGIVLVLVAVLGMTFWHLLGNPEMTHRPTQEVKSHQRLKPLKVLPHLLQSRNCLNL